MSNTFDIYISHVLSAAFDNIDSAVKAPSYTPTPCLKIRNMFDLTL